MLLIVLECAAAAVLYGVVHDQITARVSRRYFTLDHPSLGYPAIFHNPSPTVLGIAWGIVATLPLGTVLGVCVAFCATLGRWPEISPRAMRKPIACVLVFMACCAVACGFAGYALMVHLHPGALRRHPGYVRSVGVACAHAASYAAAGLGAIVLCIWTVRRRRRLARAACAS